MWEGLCCVGFVYKIIEIMAANSDNSGGRVVGLLCVERNRAGSDLAVHLNFFPEVLVVRICIRLHMCRNTTAYFLVS